MSKILRSFAVGALLLAGLLIHPVQTLAAPDRSGPTPTATPLACLPAAKAAAQGLIQLTLTGNGQLFFKNPLHYQVVNLTTKALVICFPVGQIANPGDDGYQSLMIVKQVIVDLAPNGTQEGDLDAFCINEHKEAPADALDYHLGKMASGSLLSLAQAIDAQSAQQRIGAQLAVWAITDGDTLSYLNTTPVPGAQPSLTDTIRPLLCLAQDDVTLGQQLLQQANAGVSLYSGENPLTSYCQSQGIPSLGQIGQRLQVVGIAAAAAVVVGALLCVGVIVGLIVLLVRLARRRK